MAVKTISRNNIPLKAYLRADPHSQHYKFELENRELVDSEMFWGDDGLYLDFTQIDHRMIQVAEGISENSSKQTLHKVECDEWIRDNILGLDFSRLFVIQGYAGCGKTTFMNYIIRNGQCTCYTYIDVGEHWSYPQEPNLFFNESLSAFDSLIEEIGSYGFGKRNKVWNRFIELASDHDLKNLEIEFQNIIPDFKRIKSDSKNWKVLKDNLHQYLNNQYKQQKDSKKRLWHSMGQTQVIIALFILFKCALHLETHGICNYTLIFDNLDVISDPSITSENVVLLWGVMDRYIKYSDIYNSTAKNKLPAFKFLIAVRKVLFSHITSHLPDLEMPLDMDVRCVNDCDISLLYQTKDVLYHRISYWEKHVNDGHIINKLNRLKSIIAIHENAEPEETKNEEDNYASPQSINLDAFFNHNYRALSNILSEFVDNSDYDVLFPPNESQFENWQKVASLIFSLSLLYRKEKVWNSMGFGCKDFDSQDYPTTLNRLILNYLYISRQGQILNQYTNDRSGLPTETYTSLRRLIDTFRKVTFFTIKVNLTKEQINSKKASIPTIGMEELVMSRLADMCARTPMSIHANASGYDSDDDEHWRRPLYFVGGVKLDHTAATHEELKEYFKLCISRKKSNKVLFSITDEGFILIRDIVANFEFYSGRYCDRSNDGLVKPLYQATSVSELDTLINPVYEAIEKCCERSLLFKEEYMKKYGLSINEYLRQYFHPRTHPRFDIDHGAKELKKRSFRPQLHIVRVIYSHIAYFNDVLDCFLHSYTDGNSEMCECLITWVDRYLQLYRKNFYSILANTICNSDNNVYHDLCTFNEQIKQSTKRNS